jgi:hypothetical protein
MRPRTPIKDSDPLNGIKDSDPLNGPLERSKDSDPLDGPFGRTSNCLPTLFQLHRLPPVAAQSKAVFVGRCAHHLLR